MWCFTLHLSMCRERHVPLLNESVSNVLIDSPPAITIPPAEFAYGFRSSRTAENVKNAQRAKMTQITNCGRKTQKAWNKAFCKEPFPNMAAILLQDIFFLVDNQISHFLSYGLEPFWGQLQKTPLLSSEGTPDGWLLGWRKNRLFVVHLHPCSP